jgi:glycine/D-amino acid oxidase-like deaminating enzyme
VDLNDADEIVDREILLSSSEDEPILKPDNLHMGNVGIDRRVAVLGGGLSGCCTALVLAERGARVTIFDRTDRLVSRTSLHNEGKIHFGYVYAGDSSLATARMMIRGALVFPSFMRRYLGLVPERIELSSPHVYLVHTNTQRSLEYVSGYFGMVHALIDEAASRDRTCYFGADLHQAPRRWSAAELSAVFNPAKAVAAFDTQELAVEPYALAQAFRDRISATPAIELRLRHTVHAVSQAGARLSVVSEGPGGTARDDYDHVVNALWDGRLAIDATLGLVPKRPWLYRFRYGVRFESHNVLKMPPSLTMVHGPFGGVVCYTNGAMYLDWYPACRVGSSNSLEPPDWPTHAAGPLRSRIVQDTVSALAEIIPVLGALDPGALADASVVGGNIFAWGSTDTDDATSELHQRHDIGVMSVGSYHSVDPGKLSMAPYFAEICADRIVPS